MTRPRLHSPAATLAVVLTLAACAPAQAQTGGHAGHAQTAAPARAKDYVDADVHFMQGMIHHHQQALEMAAMAPSHSSNERLQLLARKIDLSQRDEIASMEQWLRDRKLPLPDDRAHHEAHHGADTAQGAHGAGEAHMPGMLSPEQMAQLDRSRGAEFDRLFLEFMIQHHLGALQMVKELYEAPGAGQEPVLFQFASDVDADQRAEIDLMQRLLDTLPNPRSQTR